jgi:toxin ParE1/3/4
VSRYTISPEAREDLKGIYRHIAAENPAAAEKLWDSFFEGIRLLARQPHLGQACPNLRSDLRAFTLGNYVIFYVPANGGVQIERVLHGARDIESLF